MHFEEEEEPLWRIFHDNSKVSLYDAHLNDSAALAHMRSLSESLLFTGYPTVSLPPPKRIETALTDVIYARQSARSMVTDVVSGEELSSILECSFGISRDNRGTDFPRPFRVAPSGGALYPIEPFLYCRSVDGCKKGLYHFNCSSGELRIISERDDLGETLPAAFLQADLVSQASVVVIMVAFFWRSAFKYAERSYRFIHIEAGHIGQNLALACTGLGLSCVTIGGFIERRLDSLLQFDGVTQSVVYTALIGGPRRAVDNDTY